MANPTIIKIKEGTIKKIATNTRGITIIKHRFNKNMFFSVTTRATGIDAPTIDEFKMEGRQIFLTYNIELLQTVLNSDFYIYCDNGDSDSADWGEIILWEGINNSLTNEELRAVPISTYSKLIDSTETPFGILQEDGCITIRNYGQAISEGDVANHSSWVKIGTSPASISSNGLLWNPTTAYVFPTAPMGMEVISSSANDIDTTGSGIQKVTIYYLDGNYVEKSETIGLNGTSAVPTVAQDIFRINYFIAHTVGANKIAAGNISIRHLTDTPIYDQIATGGTMAKTLLYTIPAGKTLHVNGLLFSVGANAPNKRVTFTTRGTYNFLTKAQTTGGFLIPYTEITLTDSTAPLDLDISSKFPEKTDLMIVAGGETGAVCTANARGWIETN